MRARAGRLLPALPSRPLTEVNEANEELRGTSLPPLPSVANREAPGWILSNQLMGVVRTITELLISRNLGEPNHLQNQPELGARIEGFGGGEFGAKVLEDLAVGEG